MKYFWFLLHFFTMLGTLILGMAFGSYLFFKGFDLLMLIFTLISFGACACIFRAYDYWHKTIIKDIRSRLFGRMATKDMPLILAVNEIVDDVDPQGLLKMGAPSDEYAGISTQIAMATLICNDQEELGAFIHALFVVDFSPGLVSSPEPYFKIAEAVYQHLGAKSA